MTKDYTRLERMIQKQKSKEKKKYVPINKSKKKPELGYEERYLSKFEKEYLRLFPDERKNM